MSQRDPRVPEYEVLRKLREDGWQYHEIAEHYGVEGKDTIMRAYRRGVREAGLSWPRPRVYRGKLPAYPTLKELAKTHTQAQIGEMYGVKRMTVSRAIRRGALAVGDPVNPWSRIPPYRTLKRMYQDGLSYEKLGKKIDVDIATLHRYMKREALKAGDEWPLKRKKPTIRPDTVKASLVAHEIFEFCEAKGWTRQKFADECGISIRWLYSFTGEKLNTARIRAKAAKQIMDFIMENEDKEAAA